MGDAERDIFWLGIALQTLWVQGQAQAKVKGKDSISNLLGQTIAALRRIDVSGNLLTEAEGWATHFIDSYAEDEPLRNEDKDRFVANCKKWADILSDLMKERFAHPKEIYDRLAKIDEMHTSIQQLQTAEHQFVCTSPVVREIRDKVTAAIDNSVTPEEILLTGYFDNALVNKLVEALKKGVQVRLIVPRYKVNERDNINATGRLRREGGQVRQHDTNHARLMVFGNKVALVSSADPKTDGLDQNYEAGIWTTNRTLLEKCKEFFELLWNESTEWNM